MTAILRASVIAAACTFAAPLVIASPAVAHEYHNIATGADTPDVKTLRTAASLRDLWVGHIFWVRNVALETIAGNDKAAGAAEDQVVANARSIATAIEPFYGKAAADGLFKLLAGHYGAVKAYLAATVAKDPSGQSAATEQLTTNAGEIAAFLSSANPNLPKDDVNGLLLAHGGHHIQQIQELDGKDYAAEAKTWGEMKDHMHTIADALADALAKQFANQF